MGIIPDGDHGPMSEDMAKSLLGIVMLEMQDKNLKTAKEILKGMEESSTSSEDDEALFPFRVVEKRIEIFGFNLKFTIPSFLSFGVFPDRVGAVVIMLIDILETLGEEGTITLNDIAEKLYPYGFYNEAGLEKRIDMMRADKELPEVERKYKYSYVY
jgi:hypothetical protein